MKKLHPPKTAFFRVSVGQDAPFVVEAISAAEARDFAASRHITVEPYPVDKLVAYIRAGGEPIKVPPRPKRVYVKKAKAHPHPTETAPFNGGPAAVAA